MLSTYACQSEDWLRSDYIWLCKPERWLWTLLHVNLASAVTTVETAQGLATIRLGIDTLLVNILVAFMLSSSLKVNEVDCYMLDSADRPAEWCGLWRDQWTALLCTVARLSTMSRRSAVQMRPMYVKTFTSLIALTPRIHCGVACSTVQSANIHCPCCPWFRSWRRVEQKRKKSEYNLNLEG